MPTLLDEAPRLIAWAKRNHLMSEKPRPTAVGAAPAPDHLTVLVHVELINGEWVGKAEGVRRSSGASEESAVRRAGVAFLSKRKRTLSIPGILQDDDANEADRIAGSTWKVSWNPDREA